MTDLTNEQIAEKLWEFIRRDAEGEYGPEGSIPCEWVKELIDELDLREPKFKPGELVGWNGQLAEIVCKEPRISEHAWRILPLGSNAANSWVIEERRLAPVVLDGNQLFVLRRKEANHASD